MNLIYNSYNNDRMSLKILVRTLLGLIDAIHYYVAYVLLMLRCFRSGQYPLPLLSLTSVLMNIMTRVLDTTHQCLLMSAGMCCAKAFLRSQITELYQCIRILLRAKSSIRNRLMCESLSPLVLYHVAEFGTYQPIHCMSLVF